MHFVQCILMNIDFKSVYHAGNVCRKEKGCFRTNYTKSKAGSGDNILQRQQTYPFAGAHATSISEGCLLMNRLFTYIAKP